MKYLKLYILTGVLLGGICLTSCNEDDFIKNEETNHPSQTDEVPEGYAKVCFSCSNSVQTRVATGSVKNYVSYVDAYIYEENGEGNFTLMNKGVDNIYQPTEKDINWPLSYVKELMKGRTYKAVFLGNVNNALFDEEVLTGVDEGDNFTDAVIHRPKGTVFSGNNLFYIAVTSPFIVEDDMDNIPVTLKRIVSGHTIANYGFEGTSGDLEEIALGMLAEGQPLGDQIFGGQADSGKDSENKSLMWKQLHEQLLKDFMFPAAYMLKKANYWDSSGTAFDSWWAENENSFWNNYASDTKSSVDANWQTIKRERWLSYAEEAKPVVTLITDLYSNKSSCIDRILAAVKTQNLRVVNQSTSVAEGEGTYTLAKKYVAEQLATALGQTSLFPLKANDNVEVTLNSIPSTLGFDLKVKEQEESVKQTATVSSAGTLDFYLLGTKSEGYAFGYSSISTENGEALSLPENIPGQSLESNVRTTYRVAPAEGSLTWNGATDSQEEDKAIIISYNTVINTIIDSGITSLKAEDLHNEKNGGAGGANNYAPFRATLITAYKLFYNNVQFHITPQSNQEDLGVVLSLGNEKKQLSMSMPVPEFGDLDVNVQWTYESSKSSKNMMNEEVFSR